VWEGADVTAKESNAEKRRTDRFFIVNVTFQRDGSIAIEMNSSQFFV
jgi:hypothetical protein